MKTILAVLFIVAMSAQARAKDVLLYSLERLTDESPSIGVYTVTDPGKKVDGKFTTFALTLALKEKVKGEPPAAWKTPAEYFAAGLGVPLKQDLAAGDRLLVFFGRDAKGVMHEAMLICLTKEAVWDSVDGLAVNARLEILTGEKAILDTVRDRMQAHPGTDAASGGETAWDYSIEIPENTALYKRIWEGSGCSLALPADLAAPYQAQATVREIVSALQQYYYSKHSMPKGGSGKIIETLMNSSATKGSTAFFPMSGEAEKKFNKTGKFFDPWGTPYRINASNPKFPWAYSCGPNKIDEGGAPGSDDIVSW